MKEVNTKKGSDQTFRADRAAALVLTPNALSRCSHSHRLIGGAALGRLTGALRRCGETGGHRGPIQGGKSS